MTILKGFFSLVHGKRNLEITNSNVCIITLIIGKFSNYSNGNLQATVISF